jgi:hypothetical protein
MLRLLCSLNSTAPYTLPSHLNDCAFVHTLGGSQNIVNFVGLFWQCNAFSLLSGAQNQGWGENGEGFAKTPIHVTEKLPVRQFAIPRLFGIWVGVERHGGATSTPCACPVAALFLNFFV